MLKIRLQGTVKDMGTMSRRTWGGCKKGTRRIQSGNDWENIRSADPPATA